MEILSVAIAVIVVLGTVWALLSRRPRRVKRIWSWRRICVRTLDYFIADSGGQRVLVLLLFLPFVPQLIGYGRSIVGFGLSIIVAVAIVIVAIQRAAKWMTRESRPMDEVRQRFEDKILSREYRSSSRKKR